MLPPSLMLAIKKRRMDPVSRAASSCLASPSLPSDGGEGRGEDAWSRRFPLSSVLLAFVLCAGCAPPGPRTLLKGERLIGEGKYEEAIESLQSATRLLPKNAQAYNHLGLALHGARQFAPA